MARETQQARTRETAERLDIARYGAYNDLLQILNKDERTAAIKNYEFYVEQEQKAGRSPKGFDDWNREDRTADQKDYDRYLKDFEPTIKDPDPMSFHQWNLQTKKAGATRIGLGEKVETAEALGRAKERQDLTSFQFREDIDKEVEKVLEDDFEYRLEEDEAKKQGIKEIRTADLMEQRILASSEVVSADVKRLENGEFGWEVTFKDGSTQWVRFK